MEEYSPFTAQLKRTTFRGTTGRGKQGHFHLLDKYIKRIDAILPEDMEDLVRPLSYNPNLEQTSRTIKITFMDEFDELKMVEVGTIKEEEVREFLGPFEPEFIALGWNGTEGSAEVYVKFESNEVCQQARKEVDKKELGGHVARVRFTVDNKFRRVMEDLGFWEMTKKDDEPEDDGEAEGEHAISSWVAPPRPPRRSYRGDTNEDTEDVRDMDDIEDMDDIGDMDDIEDMDDTDYTDDIDSS